jgi:hypothetical protein
MFLDRGTSYFERCLFFFSRARLVFFSESFSGFSERAQTRTQITGLKKPLDFGCYPVARAAEGAHCQLRCRILLSVLQRAPLTDSIIENYANAARDAKSGCGTGTS